MKAMIFAIFASTIFAFSSAMADTTASESVWFDGNGAEDEVSLYTEKTRTEYRTITVPATCHRTEYRYQCRPGQRHCRPVCDSRGMCRTVCTPSRPVCRNIPVRVPYPCQRQITQSYEVFDYNVNTTVRFEYDLEDLLNGAAEEFTVTVKGKDVSMNVRDSGKYLVLRRSAGSNSSRTGDTLSQSFAYRFDFVPSSLVTETLGEGVRNVSLKNGVLSFVLGKSFNHEDFIQNLKIYKSRRVITDVLLLDRDLRADQMEVTVQGGRSHVSIDLKKLGIDLPSRMRVIMTTKFDPKGAEVMNGDSFKLEASANWIFSK